LAGPLRAGLEVEQAVDSLWIFNDPAHDAALVVHHRWPEEAFQQWLGRRMHAALLDDGK
jgi:hypothetical protein